MKKDFTNVFVTFALIAAMTVGGSFYYGKKVSAELAAEKISEENKLHEQELLARQAEEQARQASLAEAERIAQEEALALEKLRIAQAKDQSAKAQAAYQAQLAAQQAEIDRQNAQAAILAQQQAAAKLEAQRIADQKAADAVAKKKASRKSRAS